MHYLYPNTAEILFEDAVYATRRCEMKLSSRCPNDIEKGLKINFATLPELPHGRIHVRIKMNEDLLEKPRYLFFTAGIRLNAGAFCYLSFRQLGLDRIIELVLS